MQRLRRLLDAQAVHVPQKEHLTHALRHGGNRLPDRAPGFLPFRLLLRGSAVVRRVKAARLAHFLQRRLLVALALAYRVHAAGSRHPVYPCGKRALKPMLADRAPYPQHGLLRRVFPVVRIAHHPQAQRIDFLFVCAHQRFKGVRVALRRAGNVLALHSRPSFRVPSDI